mmetsp:Transcript_1104/g.3050  ORF Transcript_1104/g.3050 Transcript_1104/m.3050 type:complete len:537 (+) Transcript_1104:245-1855(+)
MDRRGGYPPGGGPYAYPQSGYQQGPPAMYQYQQQPHRGSAQGYGNPYGQPLGTMRTNMGYQAAPTMGYSGQGGRGAGDSRHPQQQQLAKLQHYLGQVLSQGGPNALPYEEQVKYGVRQHVLDAVGEFPSLSVSVATFTHNNGNNVKILKLEGTAPMYYQGQKYNLPLTIYLLEGYPRAPPRVYLTPTSEMVIKSNHKFVDASGCVNSPYLLQWAYPSSNLRDLTTTLCIHFGQDPPLYAKPPNWRPAVHATALASGNFHGYGNPMVSGQPQPQPQQQQQQGGGANGRIAGAGAATTTGQQSQHPQQQQQQQQQYPPQQQQQAQASAEPPQAVFKEQAAAALARRIVKTFQAIERHTTQSVEDRLCEQSVLEERANKLSSTAEALARERDMIDECIHKYESKTKELEGWLEKHREIGKDITADLDAVFIPSDKLSEQAIAAMAKDNAIEDCMYSLEQALLNDALDPELYLKQIRSLSRKQFYHRKLCMKICERQNELRKRQMPGEPSRHNRQRANTGIASAHDLEEWEVLQDLNIGK